MANFGCNILGIVAELYVFVVWLLIDLTLTVANNKETENLLHNALVIGMKKMS